MCFASILVDVGTYSQDNISAILVGDFVMLVMHEP
jgi:hypothetical protein